MLNRRCVFMIPGTCTILLGAACQPATAPSPSRTPPRVEPSRPAPPVERRAAPRRATSDTEGGLVTAARVLLRSRGIDDEPLTLEVSEGVLSVSGKVDHLWNKRRVVGLLGHLRGVTAVRANLRIRPVEIAERALRNKVNRTLAAEPAVDESRLKVTLHKGLVTLHGQVNSRVSRRAAEHAVARLRGVTEIRNKLTVRPWKRRTDARIKVEISAALRRDTRIRDGLIKIRVNEGKVILSGYVGSLAERHRALEAAWVRGVQGVRAPDLAVESSFNPPRARRPPRKLVDARIQRQLRIALDTVLPRSKSRVTVAVAGGVATLVGALPTLAARRRARQVAENTAGVIEVRDRVRVKPPRRVADTTLAKRIREALAHESALARLSPKVAVSAGVVSLSGTAPNHALRERVERVVSRISGVKAIASRLRVEPQDVARPDHRIRRDIRQTLRWRADIDDERIRFKVHRGRVRLEGTVSSVGQRNEVGRIARGAGAVTVENRLAIGLP